MDKERNDNGTGTPSPAEEKQPTRLNAGALNLRPFRAETEETPQADVNDTVQTDAAAVQLEQLETENTDTATIETSDADKPPLGDNQQERKTVTGALNLRPFRPEDDASPEAGQGNSAVNDIDDAVEEYESSVAADESGGDSQEGIRLFDDDADAPIDTGTPREKRQRRKELRKEEKLKAKPQLTQAEIKRQEARQKSLTRLAMVVLGIVMALSLVLAYFLLIVDEIEVLGCEQTDTEGILEASGLSVGQHLWLARLDDAREEINRNPYVKDVRITRVYPDKLVINITERYERAVIMGMNVYAVIDEEGYVMSITGRSDYAGLIKIYGTGSSGYQVNQRLIEATDVNAIAMVQVMAAIASNDLLQTIESLDMSNPLSIYMTTFSGLSVHIGQLENVEDKFNDFVRVLPELRTRGLDSSGTIELDGSGRAVYSPPYSSDAVTIIPDQPTGPLPTQDSETPDISPSPELDPDLTPDPDASPTPSQPAASPTEGFSG